MTTYYISLNGLDSNSGDKDSPLASLEEARNRARRTIKKNPNRDINIIFKRGFYSIDKTVVFSYEDSRESGHTSISAEKTGDVTLSGGIPLQGWQKCTELPEECPPQAQNRLWEVPIPNGVEEFHVLYRGMKRLERARSTPFSPIKGDFSLTRSFGVEKSEDRVLLKQVPFLSGEVETSCWAANGEVFFTPVPWQLSFLPVESIDTEANIIRTTQEGTVPAYFKPSENAWLENLIRDIKPGSWCSIKEKAMIYYWPKEGESLHDSMNDPVYIPALREILKIDGDNQIVKGMTLKGLTFCHGDRYERKADHKGRGIQHDWDVFDYNNALVRLRNSQDCHVQECRFTATGGSALRLDLHCQNILVEKNLIDYVGAMGILLCGYGPGVKDVNHNNEIRNNLIHHCGEIIRHGHGIFLFQSGNNHIHHNRIHHVPRKGIGLNGVRVPMLENPDITWDDSSLIIRWAEIEEALMTAGKPDIKNHGDSTEFWHNILPFLHTRNNLVEYNDVYRALEDLGDGSAINVSGAGEGNVIRRNYIHHIRNHEASGAVRVDDWQAGTTMAENLIFMINLAGFVHKNYNHIENNILVDCSSGEYIRFASYPDEEAHYGSRIMGNIFFESHSCANFYKPAYMVSPGISKPEDCQTDRNIFYCGYNPVQALDHIHYWQEKGVEKNSLAMNPFKEQPSTANFHIEENDLWPREKIDQILHGKWGLTQDYPSAYLALDFQEEEEPSFYHRGRDSSKKAHDFW